MTTACQATPPAPPAPPKPSKMMAVLAWDMDEQALFDIVSRGMVRARRQQA